MLQFIMRPKGMPVLAVLAVIVFAAAVAAFASNARSVSAIGPPEATLYENVNFNNDPQNLGGRSLTITGDISCLQSAPFNFPSESRSIEVVPGTIAVLFEKCDYQGKAAAYTDHDADLATGTDNEGNVKVASVRIIPNRQSLGNDHNELLDKLVESVAELNLRIDTLEADLLADSLANTNSLLADAAATKDAVLADSKANKDALLADSKANKVAILADVATHDFTIKGSLAAHNTALDAVAALTTSIFAHANPDPFTVTLQTCMALEGGAEIVASLGTDLGVEANFGIGIDLFGNGLTVETHGPAFLPIPVPGLPPVLIPMIQSAVLESGIGASGTLGIEACYAGVTVPFENSDGTPKTHKPVQQAYIAAQNATAGLLQNPTLLDAVNSIGLDVENMGTVIAGLVNLIPSGLDLADRDEILAIGTRFTDLASSLPLVGDITLGVEAAQAALLDPCNGLDIPICQAPLNLDNITATDLFNTFNVLNTLPDQVTNLFNGATTFAANSVGELSATTTQGLNDLSATTTQGLNDLDASLAGLNTVVGDLDTLFNGRLDALDEFTTGIDDGLAGLQTFVGSMDTLFNGRLDALEQFAAGIDDGLAGLQTFVGSMDTLFNGRLDALEQFAAGANAFATNAAQEAKEFAANTIDVAVAGANAFATSAAFEAKDFARNTINVAIADTNVAIESACIGLNALVNFFKGISFLGVSPFTSLGPIGCLTVPEV